MVVTGPQTKASITSAGSSGTPSLIVGANGSGYLRVDNGAWLQVGNPQSGVLSIAGLDGGRGIGSVEVIGNSSLVTIGSQLVASGGSLSSMSVRDGAVVRVGSLTNVVENAVQIQSNVELAGNRTELQTNGLTIGRRDVSTTYPGFGRLRVADGAIVRSLETQGSNSRAFVGYGGSLELDGGTLAMSRLELEGHLSGPGEVTGIVAVDSTGQIEVGEGESLQINGFADVAGRVRVIGGQLDVGGLVFRNESNSYRSIEVERGDLTVRGTLTNNNVEGFVRLKDSAFTVVSTNTSLSRLTGELIAEGSTIRLQAASRYAGSGYIELVDSELLLTGQLMIEGSTSNPASLVIDGSTIRPEVGVTDNATLMVHGLFEVRGQHNKIDTSIRTSSGGVIRVADGASVDFTSAEIFSAIDIGAGSSVDFSERASMFYEVAVALGDSNLTTPSVVGAKQLSFGNKLIIDASAVSEIAAGQTFSLFEADSLLGSFSAYSFPDLPGTLEFVPQQTETDFSLLVIDAAVTLPGDYNGDGCVDAADYTVLRDSDLPASNAMAMAMANWQTNYGRWLPGSNMPIPEPTAVVVASLGGGLSGGCGLRRRVPIYLDFDIAAVFVLRDFDVAGRRFHIDNGFFLLTTGQSNASDREHNEASEGHDGLREVKGDRLRTFA
ncbi:unnamed protein product [Symbiodinium sp. CCMP2456]|nr:unnamed protein product [Symbiodinium sp. CCMP2456]